jgi:ATP-dependent DNA ligase
MELKIGQIIAGIRERVLGPTPPRDHVQLIDGGPAAPELATRPAEYSLAPDPFAGGARWDAEVKIDGIRCLFIDSRLVTLEGQPMNCARHCLADLVTLQSCYGVPMFFDAEYVEEEGFEATQRAYAKGEGQGTLWVFDAVPLAQWKANRFTETREVRKAQLLAFYRMRPPLGWVGVLESFPVLSHAEVVAMTERIQKAGHEGLVLKRCGSVYERCRSAAWLKIKPEVVTDMRLIDVLGNDKTGARKLVVRDVSGPVTLSAGFSDARRLIWENRELFLGTEETQPGVIVEVKHNGRTLAGKPRHAVFSKLRYDRLPAGAVR